ncbi:glutaminase A [Nocardia colli]|uniref:Glutaminase n=1 Tax=Nocardia colli TaxID=2545717 RepID=A0A5N0E9Z7_9NOCA|nr:glutaminase A [Nocardia colli]KAA8886252.1 glutaminase A [Nocardia colli]
MVVSHVQSERKLNSSESRSNLPAESVPTSENGYYRKIFDSFSVDSAGCISPLELMNRLHATGLSPRDPRIRDALDKLTTGNDSGSNFERFVEACQTGQLIARALRGDLVIPDFASLTTDITEIYDQLRSVESGRVADYIPQLGRVDPQRFGVALCTTDGQRFAVGDAEISYCVQSVSKPINYCLALEEHGAEVVHSHVGREPSGLGFNELSVNSDGLPHNPMINAGAIMSTSLLKPAAPISDRFAHVADTWRRLTAGGSVGFNNAVYLSERKTADRNFALGYFMREHGAFPDGTDLIETLEFYFQCCSIEIDTNALSVVAGTLANAGINPLTGERVFSVDTVQKCLSLMSSCGMYDYSGEFAFTIGLPAKSGVSGALMLVVPGVMGVGIWSPRLDSLGNSVRAVEFCKKLVAIYNFHVFDSLTVQESSRKRDPRRKRNEGQIEATIRMLWSASRGDLDELRASLATGIEVGAADYDGRTALHLAAAEGHTAIVRFLLDRGAQVSALDRWGGTPLSDAERGGYATIVDLLRQAESASDTALDIATPA